MVDKYCIADNYIINPIPPDFLDFTNNVSEKEDLRFQDHVYKKAHEITLTNGYLTILDIGTGSGRKLIRYFKNFETIGSEIGSNYEHLLRIFPFRKWIKADYSKPIKDRFDMIICADVIEHIHDPDEAMNYIKECEPKCIVLSTPARELLPKELQPLEGPPNNHFHIREWTTDEFYNYCFKWFDIEKYALVYNFHWGNTGVTMIFMKRGFNDIQ